MKVQIISCYKSSDNFIIAMCRDTYYKYLKRLNNTKCDELIRKVINAGFIESSRWEIGEQL